MHPIKFQNKKWNSFGAFYHHSSFFHIYKWSHDWYQIITTWTSYDYRIMNKMTGFTYYHGYSANQSRDIKYKLSPCRNQEMHIFFTSILCSYFVVGYHLVFITRLVAHSRDYKSCQKFLCREVFLWENSSYRIAEITNRMLKFRK